VSEAIVRTSRRIARDMFRDVFRLEQLLRAVHTAAVVLAAGNERTQNRSSCLEKVMRIVSHFFSLYFSSRCLLFVVRPLFLKKGNISSYFHLFAGSRPILLLFRH
jgi:hypothetical protein